MAKPSGSSKSGGSRIPTETVLKLLLLRLQKVPQKQQLQMLGYTKNSSLSRIASRYDLAKLESSIRDAVFLDDAEDEVESDPDIEQINKAADDLAKDIMTAANEIFLEIKSGNLALKDKLEALDKTLNAIERARKIRFKVRGIPDDRKLTKPGEETQPSSNFDDLLKQADGDA